MMILLPKLAKKDAAVAVDCIVPGTGASRVEYRKNYKKSIRFAIVFAVTKKDAGKELYPYHSAFYHAEFMSVRWSFSLRRFDTGSPLQEWLNSERVSESAVAP